MRGVAWIVALITAPAAAWGVEAMADEPWSRWRGAGGSGAAVAGGRMVFRTVGRLMASDAETP